MNLVTVAERDVNVNMTHHCAVIKTSSEMLGKRTIIKFFCLYSD